MTIVIERKNIDEYLAQVENLEPEMRLSFINEQIELHTGQDGVEPFFKGERAFYSKNYEKSLVHYMQARSISRFEFFCYRATAFLSFSKGDREKALLFVEKALKERPEDPSTLELKQSLLEISAPEETPPMIENTIHKAPTSSFIASKLGLDLDTEQELEQRIQAYHIESQEKFQAYLGKAPYSEHLPDHSLWIFNGWDAPKEDTLLPRLTSSEGGLFIRWNTKGIVINPGRNFLDRFHAAGLHISQIDYVIVTRESSDAYTDIGQLYELNYQLNKLAPELHLIHYYLNHKAYQSLAHQLKPNFKQERNTVHSLELFLDSPDVEKEELSEGITLHYFAPGTRGGFQPSNSTQVESLGVRLDLRNGQQMTRIGYLSNASWTPALSSSFGEVDLLIAGFGATGPNDYGKLNYNEYSLGYFGTFTLLEELKPKLLLVSEFEGHSGDIRMEVIRKLRKEFVQANPHDHSSAAILPADRDMLIDLKSNKIKCSVNEEKLDPSKVQVVKTREAFGRLCYLSPDCLL